jgi:hypothetical protein
MNPVERDDFAHALGQTMEFYNKELDKLHLTVWLRSLRGRPLPAIKRALADHMAQSRYAPKPVDIITLLDASREIERAQLPPPKAPETSCPPEIAKAWMWFLGRITKDSKNFDGLFSSHQDIDLETQERYLHIVNHEARNANEPDAIPDEYKLQEVWG